MSKKKQQTAAGLFFSMLLRAAVIILGIAIVVFGAFFVMQMVKGGSSGSAPATTLDENALTDAQVDDLQMNPETETASEESQEGEASSDAKDKNILVLNSTDVVGLAGRWCDTLNADGYENTAASDYSGSLSDTKVISTQEGVGEELVGYFASASYEVGTVTEGAGTDVSGYDIVIIIGTADSDH